MKNDDSERCSPASFGAVGREEGEPLPKGLSVVLTKQSAGFWSQLGHEPANPEFSTEDVPNCIYTLEPWIGCLWGTSCEFCYVPNIMAGFYPGATDGYWYKQWGRWLLPKERITARLRRRLMDGSGRTRPSYRGAFINMSSKTDPFLPIPEFLCVTRKNLEVFLQADFFLMCQTRSSKVVEDADIFSLICETAKHKKVGVSFSISTDIPAQQRLLERGGLAPERRLNAMAKLKDAGVFVSAAVAPLMPYSKEFPKLLLECAHHASVQLLLPSGFGSSTPRDVLASTESTIPGYRKLERMLVDQIEEADHSKVFTWGVGNKGFVGAFLAAKQFYATQSSTFDPV